MIAPVEHDWEVAEAKLDGFRYLPGLGYAKPQSYVHHPGRLRWEEHTALCRKRDERRGKGELVGGEEYLVGIMERIGALLDSRPGTKVHKQGLLLLNKLVPDELAQQKNQRGHREARSLTEIPEAVQPRAEQETEEDE